jgi:putative colanic acid biosynthesis UDP-glucose lipid carrier transferase
MNQRLLRVVRLATFGLDLFTLNLLVLLFQLVLQRTQGGEVVGYIRFWMWLNIAWMLVSNLGNLYREKSLSSFEEFCRRTMHCFFYWLCLVMVYLFFARQFELSRLYIFLVLGGQGMLLLMNRFIYLGVRQHFQRRQYLTRKVMIIGFNDTAKKLATYLEEEDHYAEVVGFCEEEENVRELTHYPILGPVSQSIATSRAHGVEEIFSTIAPEQDLGIYQVMDEADQLCIRFRVIPDLSYVMNRAFHIDYLNDIPVLSTRKEPLDDGGNRIRKRIFDIAFSGMILLLVLPWLVPIIGLLIKLESKGPIFFKQPRSGKNNQTFQCIKFRSMRLNDDAHHKQASRNDSRLTRIGRLLRKTNLDEMPQFINVFRGEMSVVGPRPHMLKHTDDYSKLIQQFMLRHFVKPGVTGWAQVNGYRGETTRLGQMEGRVKHDLWYAENWSLWLDVRIVFLTVWTTVKGDKQAF